MKKQMILLVAMVLALMLLFAGCSTQSSDNGSATLTEKNSENTTNVKEEQQRDNGSQKISRKEAVQIVLSRVKGAKKNDIYEMETDYDDGQFIYEGELLFDGYEYEFEIDGKTGEIIQWEIDRQ